MRIVSYLRGFGTGLLIGALAGSALLQVGVNRGTIVVGKDANGEKFLMTPERKASNEKLNNL